MTHNGNGSHPQIPALSAVDLVTGYPGNRYAIRNMTFDIMRGEKVAVIGPNGAGKSTLFKSIVGLLPFTSGEVSIHGADCRTSHDMIGYVPQHNDIDWTFPATVADVVMMGRARKIGWFWRAGRQDWNVIHDLLDRVGMAAFKDRQIGQLSGGQKRRVFIARALAQETDVILLDEPFSGVDVSAEDEIMAVLDRLQGDGITIVLATHDMDMARTRFDRVMLVNGRVVAFGQASEVFMPSNLKAAYGNRVSIITQDGQTMVLTDEHGH